MKLSEVKRLKVAELRAMLKERGLDTKGLKAELVGRLMSAFEAKLQAPESSDLGQDKGVPGLGEEPKPQDDESPRASTMLAMEREFPLPGEEAKVTGHDGDVAGAASSEMMVGPGADCSPTGADTEAPAISAAELDNMSTSQLEDVCVISTFAMSLCAETTADKEGSMDQTSLNQQVEQQQHVTQEESAQEQQSEVERALGVSKRTATQEAMEEEKTTSNQQQLNTASMSTSPIQNTFNTSQISLIDIGYQDTSMLVVGQSKEEHAGSAVEEEDSLSMVAQRGSSTEPSLSLGSVSVTSDQTSQDTVFHMEKAKENRPGGGGEKRWVKRPAQGEVTRGRAYYEFKEEIQYNRAKSPLPQPESNGVDTEEGRVRLDSYGGDLHFEVGRDGCSGQPRFWERCPLLWSGCRLTHGTHQGRVGFEARFEKKLVSPSLDPEDPEHHGLRLGWSVEHWNSSLMLGDVDLSYGYDARGRKVTAGKEEEFGEPFSEGDVIGCYASFSKEEGVELSFHKNGRLMGVAFHLSPAVLWGSVLYPHVLCKNTSITLNLDPTSPPWYPSPAGYTPIPSLPAGQRLSAPTPPTSKLQCEVLMMVGLPGAGKTHWARAHMKQHPEKRYTLLGTAGLLPCMKGQGRRESRLQQASQCLSELIKVAAQTPRNYILDQPNVHPSAQRQRLLWFGGFRRRAVVVFPSKEEWKRRLQEQQEEEGDQIPETDLHKVKVSCTLPEQGDLLEKVLFVELAREESQALLEGYKKEAKSLLPPVSSAPKQRKKPRIRYNNPSSLGLQSYHLNKTRFGRMATRDYNPPNPLPKGQTDGGYNPVAAGDLRGWDRTWFNQGQPYPYGQQQYWAPQQLRYWNQSYQDQDYYGNKNQGYQDQGYYGNKNQGYQDQGYYGNRNYAYDSYHYQGYC
ncbi:heterogeneous nuclear ribonucleoprotein U-like protein 2 [Coregonus clupeaformis]|uniref:heterogeneous nuclear ribonucleoprotein U-like protein 2 n=1 Tax=Coregonus clupeaformis TaxID=59861 RepID=UPI001E1C64F3|nr:heterogeneous nuclear ribonucleoprotein U-like protein 2 [Coregonus clupeaformis]